ncbi:NUDIX hydrolase [Kitasatospora sp. NBC_00240]|uniref:NUDIX domain-containing protein n=1 Tax=Kitasatospora sp. NBC_00240 TaxID=2903567 RepID=UPI00225AC2D3|nr:NUDIX hydrolase [Kitasatospora sp. NBC_00240]MCX5215915.1 NUDIX hydrolase [Kitasatospora sp. NBC_00240]
MTERTRVMAAVRVDVAYTLVSDEGGERVLLVRNRDSWSLPGGRREDGESLAQAAVRETEEEAGVVVEAGAVVHVSERIDAELHDVFTVFRAELLSGTPSAGHLDEDVSEVAWVPVARAGELMPWYADGVQALLAAGGAGYGTTRQ